MATAVDATMIDCTGTQDISNVRDLQQRLQDALQAANPITLDLSATERLDAAAAQLLLAFAREAASRELDLTWQAPSDAARNAVTLLGMSADLDFRSP